MFEYFNRFKHFINKDRHKYFLGQRTNLDKDHGHIKAIIDHTWICERKNYSFRFRF